MRKLTWEDVRKIRALNQSAQEIATSFHITKAHYYMIATNQVWFDPNFQPKVKRRIPKQYARELRERGLSFVEIARLCADRIGRKQVFTTRWVAKVLEEPNEN